MKTIFGNRKTLVSISAIMLALMLMTGGTLAWLTVGLDPGEQIQLGWLDVKSDAFSYTGPAVSVKPIYLEPGEFYPKNGTIENVGTIEAWIELKGPTFWLTHDASNPPVPYTPPLKLVPGVPQYDQYEVTFTAIAPNNAMMNYVFYDTPSVVAYGPIAAAYYASLATTPAPIPNPIGFFKLPVSATNPKERYFIVMPGSGDYWDVDGTFTTLSTRTNLQFKLDVETVLDLTKAGTQGGNEWGGALMETSGIMATQRLDGALFDIFGITAQDRLDLVWAGDPSGGMPVVSLRGAAASYTPNDFLKEYYGFE